MNVAKLPGWMVVLVCFSIAGCGNNSGGAVFVDGLAKTTPVSISSGGYAPDGYVPDNFNKGRFCGVLFRSNTVTGLYDSNSTGRRGGALFTHNNVAQNYAGPSFTNGANGWQWPQRANPADPNDPGCGGASTADPGVGGALTACTALAGSSTAGMSVPLGVYLPSAGGPVARVSGVPVAGAVCPESLQCVCASVTYLGGTPAVRYFAPRG